MIVKAFEILIGKAYAKYEKFMAAWCEAMTWEPNFAINKPTNAKIATSPNTLNPIGNPNANGSFHNGKCGLSKLNT